VDVSDIHAGHKYGLMNPETVLDHTDEEGNWLDDYNPPMTKIQDYLWECYDGWIEQTRLLADKRRVVLLINGDMTTGDKHDDELVSNRMADQIIIAKYCIEPWTGLAGLSDMRFIKGTGAHTFGFGSSEILMAEFMKAGYPHITSRVADHELITMEDGMTIDVSHHGPPPGSRKWLDGNEARYYLRSLMLTELQDGKEPPKLVLRAHYHTYIREQVNMEWCGKQFTSTIVLSPSMTFINNYARKQQRSPSRITHGIIVFEIHDGELLKVIPMKKTIDIRSKEIL